jgi:Flp pilus assembly protein TadD
MEPVVAAELATLHALVDGRLALANSDAALVRTAADKLSAVDDPRARALLPLLYARAAQVGTDDAVKADVQKLKDALGKLPDGAGADSRGALFAQLAKALAKKADGAPTQKKTDKADAGPASASADAGVAPPPPPETYDTAMQKARRAQQNGSAKEAERMAKKALELKPGSVDAQMILGFAYVERGAFGTALQTFHAVLEQNPKNCEAQIGVATALEQQGKTEDARKEYLGYIEICPTGKDAEMAKSAAARLE